MSTPLVVASVPAGHPYVRHLSPSTSAAGVGLRRLPDPHPDHPDRDDLVAGERWWPPVMLRPDWLARADYDLLHLHFGYDDQTPDQLRRMLDVLAERGRPLVLTLHDLRNPHHPDSARLTAQLDVLVPAAAALLTLTETAADAIEARWGRRPQVVPHPHVVDLAVMARIREDRRRRCRRTFRVGVAAKSLRANTDPMAVLPTILRTLHDLPDARLEISVHRDVHDARPACAASLLDWLAEVRDDPTVDVVVHDRLSDADLWDRLAGLDLAILPYRFGTHSGWLEACHDVGTPVLAPTCGAYADQGADHLHTPPAEDRTTTTPATSLATALCAAYDAWTAGAPLAGLDAEQRRTQRDEIAAAHDAVYRRVLARDLVGATR